MFCGNCGNQVKETDKYCNRCGNYLKTDVYQKLYESEKNQNEASVTIYENPILISKILLIISCFVLVVGVVPINIIYELVIIALTVPLLVLSIIYYRKRRDKMLLMSIILNSAGIYTLLGWIYYICVA